MPRPWCKYAWVTITTSKEPKAKPTLLLRSSGQRDSYLPSLGHPRECHMVVLLSGNVAETTALVQWKRCTGAIRRARGEECVPGMGIRTGQKFWSGWGVGRWAGYLSLSHRCRVTDGADIGCVAYIWAHVCRVSVVCVGKLQSHPSSSVQDDKAAATATAAAQRGRYNRYQPLGAKWGSVAHVYIGQ